MNIIRKSKKEKDSSYIAVVEVDKKFHVVQINEKRGQVESFLPSDCPSKNAGGLSYAARINKNGVKYVSSGRKRQNALRLFNKYIKKE